MYVCSVMMDFDVFVGNWREIEECVMGMGSGAELRVEETINPK